jgi:RNA polymerase primary sigma factor
MSKKLPLVASDRIKAERVRMSRETENELVIKAQLRDEKGKAVHQDAVDAILKYHSGFISLLASRFAKKTTLLTYDDFYQAGMMGLIRAIKGYDSGRGVLFLTYAGHWVRQFMQSTAYTEEDMIRAPRKYQNARFLRVNLDEPTHNGDYVTLDDLAVAPPEYQYDAEPDHPFVGVNYRDIAFDRLDERERRIIEAYIVDERTLEEIGHTEDITKERVRQIKVAAIRKLRDATLINNPR